MLMGENVFRIRRAFIVPLVIVIVLLFILLVISSFKGQAWERIILAAFFVFTSFLSIEVMRRELLLSESGLIIKKFFRVKEFSWDQITHLGIVRLGKKVYFLLTTVKGFHFFSNLVEDHARLVRLLDERLGAEKVEEEVRNYLEQPVERLSLIVMSWVYVAVILAVIFFKLYYV